MARLAASDADTEPSPSPIQRSTCVRSPSTRSGSSAVPISSGREMLALQVAFTGSPRNRSSRRMMLASPDTCSGALPVPFSHVEMSCVPLSPSVRTGALRCPSITAQRFHSPSSVRGKNRSISLVQEITSRQPEVLCSASTVPLPLISSDQPNIRIVPFSGADRFAEPFQCTRLAPALPSASSHPLPPEGTASPAAPVSLDVAASSCWCPSRVSTSCASAPVCRLRAPVRLVSTIVKPTSWSGTSFSSPQPSA